MTLKEVILKHLDDAGSPGDTTFNIQKWLISEYCSNSHLHYLLNISGDNQIFEVNDYSANGAIVTDLFDLPIASVIPLDDLIAHINQNIDDGTIKVSRELFNDNTRSYSIIDITDSECTLFDINNTDYLLSYNPSYLDASKETIESVKNAIIEVISHTNDSSVLTHILKGYMDSGVDYPHFIFQDRINYLTKNKNNTYFLDYLMNETVYHNFIADDIAASKKLGNHPIYKGQFSTIVFVGNDSYVRHYLTNTNGFRDLLQLCLTKNYVIMESYGDYRMFVYLTDSIENIEQINQLNLLLKNIL